MKTVDVTPDAQVNVEPEIPQGPLEDLSVKPEPILLVRRLGGKGWEGIPEGVAVYVAHDPLAYHVPAPIRQPFALPLVMALRYPLPENDPDPPVGVVEPPVVVGVLPPPPPDFGTYLIPVEGQSPD